MPFKKFLLNKIFHLGSWIDPYFWLPFLLFFCCVSFAELSDDEKIKFIERIAKKFPETRTFYRWQSETARTNMLRAGEITPQIYDYFMGTSFDEEMTRAGTGIYVAEDIASSSQFGDTLMKVEVEKGVPYIDLLDSETLSTLKAQGITKQDVFNLNPKVAITDYGEDKNSLWWNLKVNRGVQFKKVDMSNMSFSELKKILKPVVNSAFFVKMLFPGLDPLKPVFQILDDTPQIKDQIRILEALKPPSEDFSGFLLEKGFSNKSIKKVRAVVVNNIARSNQTEKLPQSIYNIFSETELLNINTSPEIKDIVKKIKSAKTDQQKNKIIEDALDKIRTTEEAHLLLANTPSQSPLQEAVVRKGLSYVQSVKSGAFLLGQIEDPALKRQVIQAAIPHIQSAQDGRFLIRSIPQNSQYREKILTDSIDKMKSARDGLYLLDVLKPGPTRNELVRLMVSRINSVEDILKMNLNNSRLSKAETQLLIDRGMSFIQDSEDAYAIIQIKKISKEQVESAINKGIDRATNIDDLLSMEYMAFNRKLSRDKKKLIRDKVLEKILSTAKTADDFSKSLIHYDYDTRFYTPLNNTRFDVLPVRSTPINKIITAASSQLQSVDELLGVLKNVGSIPKKTVISTMVASLPDPTIITEQDLRKHGLFVSNYKDIISIEQEKRKKEPAVSNTPIDINCLKKELGTS